MWKILLLLIPIALVISVCAMDGVEGNGVAGSRDLDLKAFDELEVTSVFQVTLHLGQPTKGVLDCDANLLDKVRVIQQDKHLTLELKGEINPRQPLKVELWTPSLRDLEASGAAKVTLIDLGASDLDVELSGASHASFEGKVDNLSLDLSGASSLDAGSCQVTSADVDLSGASNATLYVTGTLNADCSGASNLKYKGQPSVTSFDTSGAASVHAIK